VRQSPLWTAAVDDVVDEWRISLRELQSMHLPFLRDLRFCIEAWGDEDEDGEDFSGTEGILEPLLGMKLRKLDLIEFVTVDLTDEDITEFANAWPEIEELLLPRPEGFVWPTIKSLYTLSARCPLLRTLGISVDISTVPMPIEIFGGNHRLSILYVHSFYFEQSRIPECALHVYHAFPYLEKLWSLERRHNGFGEKASSSHVIALPTSCTSGYAVSQCPSL
jgi:hypothetical protein